MSHFQSGGRIRHLTMATEDSRDEVVESERVLLRGDNDSKSITLTAPVLSSSYSLTFPAATGTTGQVLQTDGSGNLSFTTLAGGITTMVQLNDVSFTSIASNDVLTYNGSNVVNSNGLVLSGGLQLDAIAELTNNNGVTVDDVKLYDGRLGLKEGANNFTFLRAHATTVGYTLTLPDTQGASNTALINDGTGAFYWGYFDQLSYALQGCLIDYNLTQNAFTAWPIDSMVSVSGEVELKEYRATFNRSGTVFTIPSSGWYTLQISVYHSDSNLSGSSSQHGLSSFLVGVKLTNATSAEYGIRDNNSGTPESSSFLGKFYFTANETFSFGYFSSGNETDEDFVIRASITQHTQV